MPAWVFSGKKQGAGNSALFFPVVFAAPFTALLAQLVPHFLARFSPLLQFSRAFLPLNLFAHRKNANSGSVAMVSAKATKLGFGTDKS